MDDIFGTRIKTRYFDAYTLDELSREADLVIGAIPIPGKLASRLLTRPMPSRD